MNNLYMVVSDRLAEMTKRMQDVGDTPIYTALFGSQNYNLDNPESDVDTHSMFMPTAKRWITRSCTQYPLIESAAAYPGNSSVKTVQDILLQFRKGNINFLELLWTPYMAVTPGWEDWINHLRAHREDFLEYPERLIAVWAGFLRQMLKRTTRAAAFRDYGPRDFDANVSGYRQDLGYNPKSLMHAMRIKETMIRFFDNNRPFGDCIWMDGSFRDTLLAVKEGCLSLEAAEQECLRLEHWLGEFELRHRTAYNEAMKAQKVRGWPSKAQVLCDDLEMDAFDRIYQEEREKYHYRFL